MQKEAYSAGWDDRKKAVARGLVKWRLDGGDIEKDECSMLKRKMND
jgi:hypothetical protein